MGWIKRLLSAVLAVFVVMGLFVTLPERAEARAAIKTRDEAVEWLKQQDGKTYGNGQCTRAVYAYVNWLVNGSTSTPANWSLYSSGDGKTGDGKDIWKNKLWSELGWTVYENTASFLPEPGDIFSSGISSGNHTGIVISSTVKKATVMDCNLTAPYNGGPCSVHEVTWQLASNDTAYAATHFIRPVFKSSSASSGRSRDDAVAWLKNQSEAYYDLDDSYGAQCSDFTSAYMNWLVTGNPKSGTYGVYNANYYPTVAGWDPSRWEVIENTASFVPEPGDIFVTNGSMPEYGHTGAVISSTVSKATIIDQNARSSTQNAWLHEVTWGAGAYVPYYFIRYKGFSDFDPCPEKVTLLNFKSSYTEDETIVFTWNDDNQNNKVTHFSLVIDKVLSNGSLSNYETIQYATKGVTRKLPAGNYSAQIIAYNSNYWESDGSDWLHAAYDYQKFTVTPAHTHSYTSKVTKAATCTADGVRTYTCSCGNTYTEAIKATGHTAVTDKAVAATCDKTGLTEGSHCSVCNAVIKAQTTVAALGHSWGAWKVVKSATAVSTGTEQRVCTRDSKHVETRIIPALTDTFFGKVNAEKPQKITVNGNKITVRSDGTSRYETAIETADDLKLALKANKFDTIIVAASHSFPDALSGSYLAAKKKAPILIIRSNEKNDGLDKAVAYIKNNLSSNGQVYILGGTAAVSEAAEIAISGVASKVTRLAGKNRYWTNRAILMEAGIADGEDLIIADANSFADALSASALGKPILLINKENDLSVEQEVFLSGRKIGHVYLLGGENAVHDSIRNDLAEVLPGVPVTRIGGATRYETSAMIAKTFFPNPDIVTLATGVNFPDGLTGGSLAYALKAPLVLTRDKEKDIKTAADYVKTASVSNFLAFGGTSALRNETIAAIAGK